MSNPQMLTATYLDETGTEQTFRMAVSQFNSELDQLARDWPEALGLKRLPEGRPKDTPNDTRSDEPGASEGQHLTSRAPWILVLPPDNTDATALYEQLEPLITLRKAQRPVAVIQLSERILGAEPGEVCFCELDKWRQALEEKIPALKRYQCCVVLAGVLAQIPFQVQVSLSQLHRVGRLSFSNPLQYRTYADKVKQRDGALSEVPVPGVPPTTGWLTLTHPPDSAGADPGGALITPLEKELHRSRSQASEERKKWVWEDHTAANMAEFSRVEVYDRLLQESSGVLAGEPLEELAALPPYPRLWLAATHGQLAFGDKQHRQGALACGHGLTLGAEEWSTLPTALKRGQVALLYACGSAGRARAVSPDFSTEPRLIGKSDVLALLPEAMLLCAEGPLAVVGHLNLLLTHPGMDKKSSEVSLDDPVVQLAAQLLLGTSVEQAFQTIEFALDQTLEKLLWRLHATSKPADANDERLDWVEWHNLRGWVILGDPAAGGR